MNEWFNPRPKAAYDYYIRILKNKIQSFICFSYYINNKIRPCDLKWVSQNICSYICMYTNAVANRAVLQLYL